jgi:hypothetical protein
MLILSEDSIRELIDESKPIPDGLCPLTRLTQRHQHMRRDFEITSNMGNAFMVAIRQSMLNTFDFSVILCYQMPGLSTLFRLRRYNGKSHYHSNPIENTVFREFHIHTATARYQLRGPKEEHFAETTNRYADLDGAIDCLLNDCGFRKPIENSPLFTGKME